MIHDDDHYYDKIMMIMMIINKMIMMMIMIIRMTKGMMVSAIRMGVTSTAGEWVGCHNLHYIYILHQLKLKRIYFSNNFARFLEL